MYSTVETRQNWAKPPVLGLFEVGLHGEDRAASGPLEIAMREECWDKIWGMADRTRDRIEEWLAFHRLPEPRAAILETRELNPRPESFTFVARAGLLQESVRLPTRLLTTNLGDPDLYAQCVADFLYRQLIRN
jgi:hypothetical protein